VKLSKFILFIVCFLSLILSGAASQDLHEIQSIVAKADEMLTYLDTDFTALYRIETQTPGGGISITRATVSRRDRTNQFLVLILEPVSDKGKGYLKIGDNLWLYDPVGKTFMFSNATERFQNTSIRNSDFDRSNYSVNYKPIKAEKVILGKYNCTLVELQAIKSNVTFPKVKLWIDETFLIRKVEDYSLSGQLLRTTAVPSYQKIGNRWVPASIIILDHLKSKNVQGKVEYEKTTITITQPSLEKLPDYVYSKEYLEKINK